MACASVRRIRQKRARSHNRTIRTQGGMGHRGVRHILCRGSRASRLKTSTTDARHQTSEGAAKRGNSQRRGRGGVRAHTSGAASLGCAVSSSLRNRSAATSLSMSPAPKRNTTANSQRIQCLSNPNYSSICLLTATSESSEWCPEKLPIAETGDTHALLFRSAS